MSGVVCAMAVALFFCERDVTRVYKVYKMKMALRRLILFSGILTVATLLVLTSVRSVTGETSSPGKVMMRHIDGWMRVLDELSRSDGSEMDAIQTRLWEDVKVAFDFDEISKRGLGHHWNKISSEERAEFTVMFTNVLKASVLRKAGSYNGEKIVYVREVQGAKRAKVQTRLLLVSGRELTLDFKVMSKDNSYVVYDVVIDGVSMISNYRSQFNDFLAQRSFDELIKALQNIILSLRG